MKKKLFSILVLCFGFVVFGQTVSPIVSSAEAAAAKEATAKVEYKK